jgi:hypothetical protein
MTIRKDIIRYLSIKVEYYPVLWQKYRIFATTFCATVATIEAPPRLWGQ